jgi:Fur family ferric uptake transcriptional regulator
MARHFENTGDFIGQTTIYRHLERLAAEGLIRKYVLDGGSACYQYSGNSREQYHLVCEICGGLIHVNCDFLDKIGRHFLKRHDFQINMLKTVFYGTCKKCRAGA